MPPGFRNRHENPSSAHLLKKVIHRGTIFSPIPRHTAAGRAGWGLAIPTPKKAAVPHEPAPPTNPGTTRHATETPAATATW